MTTSLTLPFQLHLKCNPEQGPLYAALVPRGLWLRPLTVPFQLALWLRANPARGINSTYFAIARSINYGHFMPLQPGMGMQMGTIKMLHQWLTQPRMEISY